MTNGRNGDQENNCYFDALTKETILDELTLVQTQLSGRGEFAELVTKIDDVIEKLKGGDFVPIPE